MLFDVSILPVYLTAVIALLLIPGPDMLLISSASLSYGKKVGVYASLGNATSGVILTILAALGVSAFIAVTPYALEFLSLIGGLYLLKMGWDCLRVQEVADAETVSAQKNLANALYRRAVFSNLLNPKALMFFVLFLPQFVSSNIQATSTEQLLALGLLLNVAGLLFNLLLVALAGSAGKLLLEKPSFRRNQHKLMGGVFFILALGLLSQLVVGLNG